MWFLGNVAVVGIVVGVEGMEIVAENVEGIEIVDDVEGVLQMP